MDTSKLDEIRVSAPESMSEQVSAAIMRALSLAVSSGELPSGLALPDQVILERPKERSHGDYATSVALALAKPAGMNPRAIAEVLRTHLLADRLIKEIVESIQIAGPGFVNITLARAGQGAIIAAVLGEGEKYQRQPNGTSTPRSYQMGRSG
jgi:arginyl-tRNA synthetase